MSSPFLAEQADRPRVVPILVAGFIGFLAGQILAIAFEAFGAALTHYPGGVNALDKATNPHAWATAISLVGLWIGFAAAIYFAHREGHLRALPDQWRPRWSDALYVVLGVACQFAVDLAYYPFHFKSLNKPENHLFKAAHGPGFVLIALMTTLLAPFFEEWLFRGVLYRALAEGLTNVSRRTAVVTGVVTSAVLFGLAHGEPLEFAGLAGLGVVLALLVYRTKRLVPSYVTHASFNATAVVAIIHQRAGHW
ncbi:MAG TPA: CPBP family intramembrane glutamic endopeptidase [Acidimicrobiales bacterium]|nr:CPBP family intramembrane glutamic endopeptidase [Acidimicrobiales bacterium]